MRFLLLALVPLLGLASFLPAASASEGCQGISCGCDPLVGCYYPCGHVSIMCIDQGCSHDIPECHDHLCYVWIDNGRIQDFCPIES